MGWWRQELKAHNALPTTVCLIIFSHFFSSVSPQSVHILAGFRMSWQNWWEEDGSSSNIPSVGLLSSPLDPGSVSMWRAAALAEEVWEGARQPEDLASRSIWAGSSNRWENRIASLKGRACQGLGHLQAAKSSGQKGTHSSQLLSHRDTYTLLSVLCVKEY